MKKFSAPLFAAIFAISVWIAFLLASQTASIASGSSQYTRNEDLDPMLMLVATPVQHSFLILPDMSADATPAQYGAEIYRLVCSACHGDVGQGLTQQWRLTWNPKDQNCWQSKCHAPNHPPDGFDLPHSIPPLEGVNIRYLFPTALDLYDYIKTQMPWQNKGSLTDQEYWQVTAYVLQMNGIDPGAELLNENTAVKIILRPDPAPVTQPASVHNARSPLPVWVWIGVFLAVIVFGAALLILLRAARR